MLLEPSGASHIYSSIPTRTLGQRLMQLGMELMTIAEQRERPVDESELLDLILDDNLDLDEADPSDDHEGR